jgi:uncharacterized protein YcnI
MNVLPRSTRRPRRTMVATAAATAVTGLVALALAAPAAAHVTVGADDAHRGAADSVLTFRVPNEEASATTVKVTIAFPTKSPIPSVKPAPKPGWTVATTTSKFNPPIKTDDGTITDGVSQIVYTAKTPADGVPVGGFDTFQVLVGPLPDKATSLAFPTVQGYSDGKSVSWIEPITDPANEPEHPAPTLELLAAGAETASPAATTDTAASVSASPGTDAAAAPEAKAPTRGDVDTARNLGIAGILVGVLGLAAGAFGVVRSRTSRS